MVVIPRERSQYLIFFVGRCYDDSVVTVFPDSRGAPGRVDVISALGIDE